MIRFHLTPKNSIAKVKRPPDYDQFLNILSENVKPAVTWFEV